VGRVSLLSLFLSLSLSLSVDTNLCGARHVPSRYSNAADKVFQKHSSDDGNTTLTHTERCGGGDIHYTVWGRISRMVGSVEKPAVDQVSYTGRGERGRWYKRCVMIQQQRSISFL